MLEPEAAWPVVQRAILAFNAKVPDLAEARAALVDVIREGAWAAYDPPIGKRCAPESFAAWVEAEVPRGLGTTLANLKLIAAGDEALGDAIDKALKAESRQGRRTDFVYNIHEVDRPSGTSQVAALRRLRKSAPELHAEVLAGRLSAHAAMVQAGFWPKTITVPITRPESVARALRKHMGPDDLAKLTAILASGARP